VERETRARGIGWLPTGAVGRGLIFVVAALVGLGVAVAVAGTWWSPRTAAATGRPGLLVAAREGELLLLDPSGTVVRRIPTGELSGFGAWSHDGSLLAYADGTQLQPDLVVLDARLTETLRIRLPSYTVPRFSWSPDDHRIAFSRETVNFAQVFVVDVKSGAVAVPITDPEVDARAPRWSPDGSWIAIRGGFELPEQALYAIHPDGSALTLLSRRARPVEDVCGGWTPDGRSFVFGTRGEGSAAFIVGLDGQPERMLTARALGASCPSLSPDASRIAVAVSNDQARSIGVMRLDGSGLVTPNGPAWNGWPVVWSPDGRSVVVNGRAPPGLPDAGAFLDPEARAAGRTFFDDDSMIVDWQRLPG